MLSSNLNKVMPVVSLSEGRLVGGDHPCLIIAEIGQNHQGDIGTAKRLILTAKECGADGVKFQKSDLGEKFTAAALARPYSSTHSWGPSYGEHKKHLEFSIDQFRELQKYAQEMGIMFTASAMDPVSLDVLDSMGVPFIKIGSGDAANFLLIKKAANLQKPLFISTGMSDFEAVKQIYQTVTAVHKQLVILHCVSAYPTKPSDVNLRVLQLYRQEFPDIPIGYSGHELGTAISVAAVTMGAKVIERHITLDKRWKGSDHACSLEAEEFKRMVRDIRTVEEALGSPVKRFLLCEQPCYDKLGKCVIAADDLPVGSTLSERCLKIKVSEPFGVSCQHLSSLLGKVLVKSVQKDCPVMFSDVC